MDVGHTDKSCGRGEQLLLTCVEDGELGEAVEFNWLIIRFTSDLFDAVADDDGVEVEVADGFVVGADFFGVDVMGNERGEGVVV